MTTASHALEFVTGDIVPRPGFGDRLTNWIKAKRASTGTPSFNASTAYELGLTEIADEAKLHSVTDLEPHVVLGRMMWMGVR
ncbi:MAG: hypothetical protein ACKVP5_09190 [Aestuariivirga sp.]